MLRLAGLALIAISAWGSSVFYSTDGTATPGFDPGNRWTASWSFPAGPPVSIATSFSPTVTGTLDSIVAALSSPDGVTSAVFNVRSDAAGLPGLILDTITITG